LNTARETVDEAAAKVAGAIDRERRAYSAGEERPIGSYGLILGAYAAVVGGLGLLARRRRRTLPDRVGAYDLATMAVATHKLSRLVTKDTVTAAARAPFTRFQEAAGEGEVTEEVRGHGVRHAIGELVTCPFCMAQWVATGFGFGLVLVPRATRLAMAVLTSVAVSDYLQFAYSAAKREEQSDG
jgi:hypothetical protein